MIKLIRKFILGISIPIQRWLQKQGRRETVITKEIVDTIIRKSTSGDILLSYEAQRWTSILIKGFYDHAAIITNKGTVVEAVGDNFIGGINLGGVREVDLEEWLYKKDFVAIVRVKYPAGTQAGMNSLLFKGRGYDYYFSTNNELLYCSEIPYLCWRLEWPDFLKEHGIDEPILPQQYLDYTRVLDYLDLIFDSRG